MLSTEVKNLWSQHQSPPFDDSRSQTHSHSQHHLRFWLVSVWPGTSPRCTSTEKGTAAHVVCTTIPELYFCTSTNILDPHCCTALKIQFITRRIQFNLPHNTLWSHDLWQSRSGLTFHFNCDRLSSPQLGFFLFKSRVCGGVVLCPSCSCTSQSGLKS